MYWPGKYLPFVACLGKVLWVEDAGDKRQIQSMIRLMRDPQMLYDYVSTQIAELARQIPKVPIAGFKGQFDGVEAQWQAIPFEPLAYVEFNAVTEATGSQILPPPQRIAYDHGAHLAALDMIRESLRRSIQAASGSGFLPTQAQRQNEKGDPDLGAKGVIPFH